MKLNSNMIYTEVGTTRQSSVIYVCSSRVGEKGNAITTWPGIVNALVIFSPLLARTIAVPPFPLDRNNEPFCFPPPFSISATSGPRPRETDFRRRYGNHCGALHMFAACPATPDYHWTRTMRKTGTPPLSRFRCLQFAPFRSDRVKFDEGYRGTLKRTDYFLFRSTLRLC